MSVLVVSVEDLESRVEIPCSANMMGAVEETSIVITAYCESLHRIISCGMVVYSWVAS